MITIAGVRAAFKLVRARVLWLKYRSLTNCLKIIFVFLKCRLRLYLFLFGHFCCFLPVIVAHAHTIFTALHAMQTRYSDEKAVRLSAKLVDCDKTEERFVHIFIPYERSFSL